MERGRPDAPRAHRPMRRRRRRRTRHRPCRPPRPAAHRPRKRPQLRGASPTAASSWTSATSPPSRSPPREPRRPARRRALPGARSIPSCKSTAWPPPAARCPRSASPDSPWAPDSAGSTRPRPRGDNLLGATIVTADGAVRDVGPEAEPDLYWALRGAGTGLGVVTELRMRLFPLVRPITGTLVHRLTDADAVLWQAVEATASAPSHLSALAHPRPPRRRPGSTRPAPPRLLHRPRRRGRPARARPFAESADRSWTRSPRPTSAPSRPQRTKPHPTACAGTSAPNG